MNTRGKIKWTNEMLEKLKLEFPYRFNKDLAKDLKVSWRSLVRKARELNIEKETNFLDKRREKITEMATAAKPENINKGNKDFRIPGGEDYQFKPGNISSMKDPKVAERMTKTRNETIRKERLRIKYGLPQKTKLNLK